MLTFPLRLPLLMSAIAITSTAYADTTQPVTTLGAVTVSANKINENLQTSSTSVTVVTAEDIKSKGIETIDDITKVLPNSASGSFYAGVTDWNYRGLNSSVFKGNNPVIIYVDGIAQLDRRTMFIDMNNVERIEIVHGPSGTVYGKGAIGGVINITTKQAKDKVGGEIKIEAAENGKYDISAIVSGALVPDKLLGKFAVGTRNDDGELAYVDSNISDENDDRQNGSHYSGELTFFPNDTSTLKLQLNHNEEETGYGRNDVVRFEEINTKDAPSKLDYNTKTTRNSKTDSQTLQYEQELENMRIETQLSHRKASYDGVYECDYTSTSSVACTEDIELDDLDAEIRVVSDENPVKWVAGFFAGKQEKTIHDNGYNFGGMELASSKGKHEEETQAVFGQVIYPVTDKVEVTAGARFQQQSYSTDTRYYQAANPSFGTPEVNSTNKGSRDEDAFLPKLGVSYQVNDNSTVFANYSKGALGGGYNDFQSNPSNEADDAYFKPQYNNSMEVGYKGKFDQLNVTANAFYMDIEDIHTYTIEAGSLYTAGNLKGATSKGVELEAKYNIDKHWSVDSSVGLTKAEYKDGSFFNGVDASGKTVEKTPENTATVGVNFNNKRWDMRMEAQHRGDHYYNFQNDQKVDGFTELNARVAWRKKNLEVFGYADNITDETGVTTVFDSASLSGPGTVARSFNQSRTLGVGMQYNF